MTAAVEILLSTYNGGAYLEELLISLARQDYPNLKVTIRDDGSTDNTLEIISAFNDRLTLRVIQGANLGPCGSFFELVRNADPDADFYAFCDQDDVWLPGKISRAVALLANETAGQPLMYCGRQLITDKALNVRCRSDMLTRPAQLGNALVENIATGCTVVINRHARNLLLDRLPAPENIVMHDWWLYLVVSALGKVVFDSEALILYRQHGSNSIGFHNGLARWRARLQRLLFGNSRRKLKNQALCFLTAYDDLLNDAAKKLITHVFDNGSSLMSKIKILFLDGSIYRQCSRDSFYIRLLLMTGK